MTTPPTPSAETLADAAQQADAAAAAPPAVDAIPPVRTLPMDEGSLQGLFFRADGTTEAAVWTDGLFMLTFWFSMFFFVLLMGLMVYWCIIYRRRPGVPAPVSPAHNTPLEVFWTVVPSSALLVFFFLGFWGYMDKVVPAGDALELNITGRTWDWSIEYPNGAESGQFISLGARDNVKIHALPEDTDIALRMISTDVIHSFWIPDYRMKTDVFPNRYTGYGFRTPKLGPEDDHPEGRYRDQWVFCAEYCGDLHAEMAAVIRVMPQADYEAWLESNNTAGLSPADIGKRIYTGMCATCHSVDGSNNIGPSWKDFYGAERQFNAAPAQIADDNYIRESIINPGAKIVQGYQNQMTPFPTLGEDDIANIIAYMKSISVHVEQPAEGDEGAEPAAEQGESQTDSEGEG